jgi:uncharacterized membrane protein
MNKKESFAVSMISIIGVIVILIIILSFFYCKGLDDKLMTCIDKTNNPVDCRKAFGISKGN